MQLYSLEGKVMGTPCLFPDSSVKFTSSVSLLDVLKKVILVILLNPRKVLSERYGNRRRISFSVF